MDKISKILDQLDYERMVQDEAVDADLLDRVEWDHKALTALEYELSLLKSERESDESAAEQILLQLI